MKRIWEEFEDGKLIISIYCMKKIHFQFKKNNKKPSSEVFIEVLFVLFKNIVIFFYST